MTPKIINEGSESTEELQEEETFTEQLYSLLGGREFSPEALEAMNG